MARDADYLGEIENWVDRWYGTYGSTRPTAAKAFAEIGKVLDRWRTADAATDNPGVIKNTAGDNSDLQGRLHGLDSRPDVATPLCLIRQIGTDAPLERCADYPRCKCGGPEGWTDSADVTSDGY